MFEKQTEIDDKLCMYHLQICWLKLSLDQWLYRKVHASRNKMFLPNSYPWALRGRKWNSFLVYLRNGHTTVQVLWHHTLLCSFMRNITANNELVQGGICTQPRIFPLNKGFSGRINQSIAENWGNHRFWFLSNTARLEDLVQGPKHQEMGQGPYRTEGSRHWGIRLCSRCHDAFCRDLVIEACISSLSHSFISCHFLSFVFISFAFISFPVISFRCILPFIASFIAFSVISCAVISNQSYSIHSRLRNAAEFPISKLFLLPCPFLETSAPARAGHYLYQITIRR